MINQILRRYKKKTKLNILTCSTHERTDSNLHLTGHNFFHFNSAGIKKWNETYAPVPKNAFLMPENYLPPDVQFDVILSQEKGGQYPKLFPISKKLGVPLICLEHTLPYNNSVREEWQKRTGDVNIFISEYSKSSWGIDGHVVEHGVDTGFFKPGRERKSVVLSVVNDWINRTFFCGFDLWKEVTHDLPVQVWGDTPGLSVGATPEKLREEYATHKVFLNTSLVSPIPTVMLEAAASGCAIVSTNNCAIPETFIHGHNALLSNDPAELNRYCKLLLTNENLCQQLGKNARETVKNCFSLEKYIKKWKKIFEVTSEF